MSQYHPTRPDDIPFNIPFKRGGQDFHLREDRVGPVILRVVGEFWYFVDRPDKEQIAEILAATGND